MWCEPKNDSVILNAIKAQTNGRLTEASALFQRAGNQERNPADKEVLWKAAKHAQFLDSFD